MGHSTLIVVCVQIVVVCTISQSALQTIFFVIIDKYLKSYTLVNLEIKY